MWIGSIKELDVILQSHQNASCMVYQAVKLRQSPIYINLWKTTEKHVLINHVSHSLIIRIKCYHYISQMFSSAEPFSGSFPLSMHGMWYEFFTQIRAILKNCLRQEYAFNASHKTVSATKGKWSIFSHLWWHDHHLYFLLLPKLIANLPPVPSPKEGDFSRNTTNLSILRNRKMLFDWASAGRVKNNFWCLKMCPLHIFLLERK